VPSNHIWFESLSVTNWIPFGLPFGRSGIQLVQQSATAAARRWEFQCIYCTTNALAYKNMARCRSRCIANSYVQARILPLITRSSSDAHRRRSRGVTGPPMTGLGAPCTLGPQLWHKWTVTKYTVFGKINSLLLINPHAITYAMVEVFCHYRLG